MVKMSFYSSSVVTVLTPYRPFTCVDDKIKSEARSPGLTGGGTSCLLRGTVRPFLVPEECDVLATTWHSVLYVWIPPWDFDWTSASLDSAPHSESAENGLGDPGNLCSPTHFCGAC